nr:hypothetical protein [Tanacetum cinerariifolium]
MPEKPHGMDNIHVNWTVHKNPRFIRNQSIIFVYHSLLPIRITKGLDVYVMCGFAVTFGFADVFRHVMVSIGLALSCGQLRFITRNRLDSKQRSIPSPGCPRRLCHMVGLMKRKENGVVDENLLVTRDEVRESEGESDEEQEEEESFDPILKTPEESEEESNDEEEQESRLSEEARIQEEEDADELYRDVNINQGRGLQVTQNVKDTHVTLTLVNPDGPQESSSMSSFVSSMLNPISDNDEFLPNIDENMKKVLKGLVKNQVKKQVSRILPQIEESVNATLEAEVLTRSS